MGQAARDRLAHAAELGVFVRDAEIGDRACGDGSRGCCGRCGRCGRGCGCAGGGCGRSSTCRGAVEVVLDDAAARPGAGDRCEVDAAFGGEALGERAGFDAIARGGGSGCRGRVRRRRSCGGWRGSGRFGFRLSRGRCRRQSRLRAGILALTRNHRNHGANLHPIGALGDQNLADHALVDRLEFHRRLVGFDLGQQVARFDGVTFLDQPFGQRAFLHRRREGGHFQFDWHGSACSLSVLQAVPAATACSSP